MVQFDSDTHKVSTDPATISSFLAVPSNLLEILPPDRIENWQSENDSCSFKIKGLADIHLRLESSNTTEVIYASTSDKPFHFRLIISSTGSENTDLKARFDAEVNSFMSMMLKTPLTNFLNSLGSALTSKYEGA